MAYENANPSVVFIKFVVESLAISGYAMNFENCTNCGKDLSTQTNVGLVYDGSAILCQACSVKQDNLKLSTAEWKLLKMVAESDTDNLSQVDGFSQEVLTAVMKDMIKQFYFRTGEKLKSLDKYFI